MTVNEFIADLEDTYIGDEEVMISVYSNYAEATHMLAPVDDTQVVLIVARVEND